MAHSGLMQLTHWIGVLLVLPPVAVVLLASWRAYATRRADRSDPKEVL